MKSDEPLDTTARGWLDAADREYTPSAADRTRVRARLDRVLSVGLGGAVLSNATAGEAAERIVHTSSRAATAASGLGWGTKAIVGALLVGSAGFGSGYWVGQQRAASSAAAQRSRVGQVETRDTPTGTRHAPTPAASAVAARSPALHDEVTQLAPRPTPTDPPEGLVPSDEGELKVETPALWQETQLLRRAQFALRAGNGRLAASLLDQLAEEFPNGALVQERSAARVLTDCALGQVERARAAATRFLAKYPSSVHAERIRRSCAGGGQGQLEDEEPDP